MTALPYRRLFGLSGPSFVITGLIGRMPLAMSQMGTMLLVASPMVAGRLGPGGVCAGAIAASIAIGAPIAGALTDRRGQREIMLAQSLISGVGLILEALAAVMGAPWPLIAVIGAITGLFLPQIGTMARVRWRALAAENPQLRAGVLESSFAWEGAADEASFALGPALVGVLAVAFGPVPALAVAGVLLLVFGTWFALHPTVRLVPARPVRTSADAGPLFTRGVVHTVAGIFFMGLVFGSVQTGTTCLATEAGRPGVAGLMHALLSVGSATAGLMLPRLARRLGLTARWKLFALALGVLAVPLLFIHTIGLLIPAMLVLGMAAAPYMITLFSVAERAASPARIGTVMTLLAATTSLGYAVGASIAGRLSDWGGCTAAYALTVGVGVAAFLHALAVSGVDVPTAGAPGVDMASTAAPVSGAGLATREASA
ncbi:MFS transporter [Acidipropionibacterium timonense]|uniref:MFS transporter n=1 Tax=Acidipropionibacterium timonense TaxID=2161818 RepID=UPI001FD9BB37|nr:MFS transporter [Acidipropionibacterium timonense]